MDGMAIAIVQYFIHIEDVCWTRLNSSGWAVKLPLLQKVSLKCPMQTFEKIMF